jgi:hypothetical protein
MSNGHTPRANRATVSCQGLPRRSEIFTSNAAGGTDVRWCGSFTEAFHGTGPVMPAVLRAAVKFFSARLVKAAERELLTGRNS